MKTQYLLLLAFALTCSNVFGQRISFSPGDSTMTVSAEDNFKHVPFQFTFMCPPLSTNGLDFYKAANDVSINTFVGISAATNEFEVAGFGNINAYYMNGFQAAGFANITGILGHYESSGVQAAGFANIHGNKFNGLQAAGFVNICNEFSGLQASGFANANYEANESVELAGFANADLKGNNVIQAAGFANALLDGQCKIQASGFGNVADEVDGIQIAGFINVANKVKGVQLAGFINICDSIDGVPIGIISYVRKNGYRSFEFSISEWAPVQLTYKMGIKKFYNIYSISKLPLSWDKYATGFGFGHMRKLSDGTELALEVVNHNTFSIAINRGYYGSHYDWGGMVQFKPTFKRHVSENISLNFGPTFNLNYGYWNNGSNDYMVQPFWKLLNSSSTNTVSRMWVGFTAGISLN